MEMNSPLKRSCLRWPGNKFSLLKTILPLFPVQINNYYEPFLGSASIYLNTYNYDKAYLSDNNELLINFYYQVKNNLNELITAISGKRNTEKYYYLERDKVYTTSVEKAAQFYYLNRTCFNGIFRVNSKGKFNVPYGYREGLKVLDKEGLLFLNEKFKNVVLSCHDFENSLKNISIGDFVFLDPPYSSKTQKSIFTMYNENLFSWNDQLRLQAYCKKIIAKGAYFMMTNLYNSEIYELFAKELSLKYIVSKRYTGISSQIKNRGIYKEYIFLNY